MQTNECRYDIQGLADELEVDLSDIVRLFSNYFTEMKEELAEMKKYLSSGDWIMLERVVHNVKGVSANLDIKDVYNEAAAFDTLLKINVTDSAEYYINRIDELLQAAEEEVGRFFSQNGMAL